MGILVGIAVCGVLICVWVDTQMLLYYIVFSDSIWCLFKLQSAVEHLFTHPNGFTNGNAPSILIKACTECKGHGGGVILNQRHAYTLRVPLLLRGRWRTLMKN